MVNASRYSVGDFAQGGIVFWVDETGQHGLVCAKEDQRTSNNPGADKYASRLEIIAILGQSRWTLCRRF